MPKIKKNDKKDLEDIKTPRKYERMFGNQFNKIYTDEVIEAIADRMYLWFNQAYSDSNGKKKDHLWLKDFAVSEMIASQRISEFAAKNDYFAFIYQLCKERQESILFHLGLLGKSSMPIFALKATAGWRDDNGENENGNKYAELAKILGQALVSASGSGVTASNDNGISE